MPARRWPLAARWSMAVRERTPRTLLALASCLIVLAAPQARGGGPPAHRSVLPNGATLIVSEQHALPMVVAYILVDAGSRRDPLGKEGLAALTADLLTEGTKTRTETQISEAADFIGAQLGSSADTDTASVSLTVLSKDLGTGVDLLTDILLHPSFPDAEVARRREAALATMHASEDDPNSVAERAFTAT